MDRWARWLLEERFGGDPAALERTLAILEPIRDRILDGARLEPSEVLLDVGTGDGLVGFWALERLGEGGRVVLSDVSADLLEVCQRIAREAGVSDHVRVVEAAAEDLRAVPDTSVDVVTTRSVLIYVQDKRAAFDAFARVLRPGGRLSLFEPINRTMQRLNDGSLFGYDARDVPDLAAKVRSVFEAALPAESPMVDFDAADLVHLAAQAGFVEVTATVEMALRPDAWLGPTSWERLRSVRPNPDAPSFGEAIEAALDPPERELLERRLRPRVEAGVGRWFDVGCFLTAVRPVSS